MTVLDTFELYPEDFTESGLEKIQDLIRRHNRAVFDEYRHVKFVWDGPVLSCDVDERPTVTLIPTERRRWWRR